MPKNWACILALVAESICPAWLSPLALQSWKENIMLVPVLLFMDFNKQPMLVFIVKCHCSIQWKKFMFSINAWIHLNLMRTLGNNIQPRHQSQLQCLVNRQYGRYLQTHGFEHTCVFFFFFLFKGYFPTPNTPCCLQHRSLISAPKPISCILFIVEDTNTSISFLFNFPKVNISERNHLTSLRCYDYRP